MDNKERLIKAIKADNGISTWKAERIAAHIAAANLLAPQWISVKERLPDHNGLVPCLVQLEGESELTTTFDRYDDKTGEWEDLHEVVRFWFDLPAAPKDNHDD